MTSLSVDRRTYQRLPYEDLAPTSEMASDATEVGRELHIPTEQWGRLDPDAPTTPAFGEPMGRLEISDHLAEMAGDLELHFD